MTHRHNEKAAALNSGNRDECFLEVRTPRLTLPDGRVVLIERSWAGKLSGFTLLFEALILAMCRQMPFAAVARRWRELAQGGGHL